MSPRSDTLCVEAQLLILSGAWQLLDPAHGTNGLKEEVHCSVLLSSLDFLWCEMCTAHPVVGLQAIGTLHPHSWYHTTGSYAVKSTSILWLFPAAPSLKFTRTAVRQAGATSGSLHMLLHLTSMHTGNRGDLPCCCGKNLRVHAQTILNWAR